MKTTYLIRISALATCLFLLQTTTLSFAGLQVEQVQRDFQVRYHLLTGGYVQWPQCSGGQSPAPQFPKDGFYGDLTQDPDKGVEVVSNLVQKFYADNIIYTSFVKATNGFSDLEGVSNIVTFASSDMQPILTSADVTTNNYLDRLKTIASRMNDLTLLSVACTPMAAQVTDSKLTYNDGSAGTTCSQLHDCTIGTNGETQWGIISEAHSQDSGCFLYSSGTVGSYNTIGVVYEAGKAINRPKNAVRNSRGKLTADLTAFVNGTARVYLKLRAPLPEDTYWSGRRGFFSTNSGTYSSSFDLSPPTGEPDKYWVWGTQSPSVGTLYTSTYLSVPDAIAYPNGACTSTNLDIHGWLLSDAKVIVAPDFTTVPDPADCCSCSACPAGSPTSTLNSIHVDIPLGSDNFGGSAGALTLSADLPSSTLATPSGLRYSLASTVQLTTNAPGSGQHLQFKTSQVLADASTNNLYSYTLSFYNATDAGTNDANGFYHPTGSAFTTILVENPDASPTLYSHLRLTTTTDGNSTQTDYIYNAAAGQWQMITGNGLRKETHASIWDISNTVRTETVTITNSNDNLVYKEINTYQLYPWGQERIQNVVDPDGAKLTNTWTFYSDRVNDGPSYRLLKQEIDANGRWISYLYDQDGRETNRVTQFLNSVLASPAGSNRVTTTTYSTNDPAITTVETLLGTEVGRRYQVIRPGEVDDIQCQRPGAAYTAADNLVTVSKKYTSGSFAGQLQRIHGPDGTVQIYLYATNSSQKTTTILSGVSDPANSTNILSGTITTTVTLLGGQTLTNVVLARQPGASDVLIDRDIYTYLDARLRSYQITHFDGTSEQFNYDCCGLGSKIDREGTVTQYFYDSLKRQIATLRNGITMSNVLDANGAVLAVIRVGSNGSPIFQQRQAYDRAGRLIAETNALNGMTTYTNFLDGAGQFVKQATFPDLGTRVETYAMDGTLLRVSGSAVSPISYTSGVDTSGRYTAEIKLDAAGGTNEWTKTYTDILGRAYKTVYASAVGVPYSISYFNALGQLTNQVDPDGVSKLYAYNAKGERTYSAVDVNTNGSIDFAGTDRLTLTTNDITFDNGAYVRRTRTFVWATAADSPTLVSTAENSVDGLRSWNTTWNNGAAVTSRSQTVYDAANGYRFVTNIAPDTSYTVSAFQSGQLLSITSRDSTGIQLGRVAYGYDRHGRKNTETDARTGTTTSFFNDADQISGTFTPSPDGIQPPQVSTNYFDNIGRVWKTTLPDNTSVTNEFYVTGLLKRAYGSRAYPVAYSYDSQGRVRSMTNYASFSSGGGPRVTTWNYDTYRGLLAGKVYDGGVVGPQYTYTKAGRLQTRLWARGITTTYGYNNAGDLSTVDYDDGSTPAVGYGFDRLGRQTSITNGAGICTLAYSDANELLSESYSNGPLDGLSVTNAYDSLLRRTAVGLSTHPDTLNLFGYDAASRLKSVTNGLSTAVYGYLTNSPLVQSITFQQNGVSRLTTTKTYDSLNRLTSISSSSASFSSSFAYQQNSANQRTRSTLADNSYWVYGYDALGQVSSGKKYWNDGTPVAGQQFEYSFDDIGNRVNTKSDGDQYGTNLVQANYRNNTLNQITSRDVPGFVDIRGSANSNATVTVNLQRAYRHGDYFRAELNAPNGAAPVLLNLTNLAVLQQGTNTDIAVTNTGTLFVAKNPETFTFDSDGNLTSDGRWTNLWSGENRLLTQMSLANAPAGSKLRVDYAYDYRGRMIQRVVSTNDGAQYFTALTNRFVYDGVVQLAEFDGGNGLVKAYTRGLDLSGTLQGAGGVGGLLFVNAGTNGTHLYEVDGNGNVTALVSAYDGSVSASYEYSPFGEPLRATGPMAFVNTLGFSSQYTDYATKRVLYLYRPYNTSSGRWDCRDPIGERGGLHVYAFIANSPSTGLDPLGLDNPISGLGSTWPADPYAPGGAYYGGSAPITLSSTARIVIFKVTAALQCAGGALESLGGAALAGAGGGSEFASGGLSTPVSGPMILGGGILFVNGGDNFLSGARRFMFSVDAKTVTEQLVSTGLEKSGVPSPWAQGVGSGLNSILMGAGGVANSAFKLRSCCADPRVTFSVVVVEGVFPTPMRAGRLAEEAALVSIGSSGKVGFTPTAEQINSAAFNVIVGDARYTASGLPVSVIYDGSFAGGLAEIKSGSSVLNSTYQLRLQTYGALVSDQQLTIFTSRPINPAFSDWLTRWAVSVAPLR
jgi:RHS repeat-associated protein